MKKFLTSVFTVTIVAVGAAALFAGSLDYLSNQSAEYNMTLSRNASYDAADVVAYNPAGTSKLEDGFYFNISNQYLFKDYMINVSNNITKAQIATSGDAWGYGDRTEFKSEEPSEFVPNAFAVYKKDNWAVFAAFNIVAGGGSLKYEDGVPLLNTLGVATVDAAALQNPGRVVPGTQSLFQESFYTAGTVGGSVALLEKMISLSGGVRYITARNRFKIRCGYESIAVGYSNPNILAGTQKVDIEQKGAGVGYIVGLNVEPIKGLNFAAHYESRTKLYLRTKHNGGSSHNTIPISVITKDGLEELELLKSGYMQRKDLPAKLGTGIAFQPIDQLKVSTSFNYYFLRDAYKKGRSVDNDGNSKKRGNGYDKHIENGWEWGTGVEITPVKLITIGFGYTHGDIGDNKKVWSELAYKLDFNAYGCGIKVRPTDMVSLTLAYSGTYYEKGSQYVTDNAQLSGYYQDARKTYTKTVHTIAVGAELKFGGKQ